MDAEQVVSKILSEAKAQADAITSEAKSKCAADEAKLNESLAEYNKETETLGANAAQDKKDRMLAGARMQLSKEYLAAKRVILDEVFAKAKNQINGLSDAEYVELMGKLLAQAVETGDEEVVVSKDETRIDLNLVKQINRDLGPGFKGNVKLSNERADIHGGFVLKRGKIMTNVSIDVLVDQIRADIEMELASELFS